MPDTSVIVAGARTPIGRLLGGLKGFSAAELGGFVLEQWVRWGLARHPHFLKARAQADAITTVVTALGQPHDHSLTQRPLGEDR
mgnify:CR=1 FL=1